MNVLTKLDEALLLAYFRIDGHPDPEGAVAAAKAELSEAIRNGQLEIKIIDGRLMVRTSDLERLWPGDSTPC